MITVKHFGVTPAGEPAQQVIIENVHGHQLGLVSYGAAWQFFREKEGNQHRDLVIGFDTLAEYIEHPYYLGAAIGRVGGRIGGASFELNGQTYKIDANENGNTLHGGDKGFADRNWHVKINEAENSVRFSTTLTEVEDGFPGTLETSVTYTLTDNNEVKIQFAGQADADTLYNPTSHVYMNPAGYGTDARELELHLASGHRLELDDESIPTGNKLANAGTAYDFTTTTKIGDNLAKGVKQFDDVFEVPAEGDAPVAVVTDPKSKRAIEVRADRNGVVFFIANPARDDKQGDAEWLENHPYSMIALEAQTLSDAIHFPELGNIILPAGEKKVYNTSYTFKGLAE